MTLSEDKQRLKKVESEIRQQSLWYSIAHVFIGSMIGGGLMFCYLRLVPQGSSNPAPVVQQQQG